MTNPLTDYFEEKAAAPSKRKEEDLQLWHAWNDNGRKPEHLEPLLNKYKGIVSQKVGQWKAPAVPESAFRAELQTHLIKAIESYDPARSALNTHVENRLQKAKRYNTRHQNFAYIPEGKARFIGPIDKARDILREDLGREPTHHEISAHLQKSEDGDYRKLTPAKVEEIQKARIRDVPDTMFETDPTQQHGSFEDQQIEVAANTLHSIFPDKPEMHEVFHYTFGTGGYPKIPSTGALAKKLGKTDQQVSRMRTQMGTTLRKHMGLDRNDDD